jgi:PAS domain S-box-containing protein
MNSDFKPQYLEDQMQLLAEMIENSAEAIIARGADKKFICWNLGAEKLFGFSKQEALGKTAADIRFILLGPSEVFAIEKQIQEFGSWKSERIFFHKNGNKFWGSVTGNKVSSKNGGEDYFYFIIKDISNHIKLETNLQRNNDELELLLKFRTEELKKTEEYYRSLFENNPMPMWVIDRETFKFLDVNQCAIQQYGYSREEFLSMTALDIRDDDDKARFKNLYRGLDTGSKTINRGVWKHKIKDGSIIYAEITAQNLEYHGLAARLILANNITEKYIAEEKLIVNEKRFKSLIENSHDAFTMFDEELNIIYRSQSSERITGWPNNEVIGLNFISGIHPDDFKSTYRKILEIKNTPFKSSILEFRLKHKNGNFICVNGFVSNLMNDENVKAIVFNFQDVTDRKISEEKLQASEVRFRSLIENSKDVFVMFDKYLNIIYRSPSADRVTGFSDADLLGKNGMVNVHPDDLAEARLIITDLLENPGKKAKILYRNKHKDGHYITIDGVMTNLLNDVSVNAIVFSFQDVTDVIKAEKERNKMNDEIIKRSKRLEQFAYIISHNLRMPVANILGIADYLKGNIAEEERTNMVAFLSSATLQLDEVIKDLNNILQIQSQIAEYKEVISMSKLVADIESSIKILLNNYHITIDIDFAAKDEITTIKSYLYSIFYNLISNSVKYRKLDEPLVISLRSKVVQDKLIITVKDNGLGFNYKQNAEKIFGLYKRFHPKIEGKGIGLFLVKTQVESLEGTISVISELGLGTEFTIEFPLNN